MEPEMHAGVVATISHILLVCLAVLYAAYLHVCLIVVGHGLLF